MVAQGGLQVRLTHRNCPTRPPQPIPAKPTEGDKSATAVKPDEGQPPAPGVEPKSEAKPEPDAAKPADEKAAEPKPEEKTEPKQEDKPAEDKPAEDKPAEDKPAEKQASGSQVPKPLGPNRFDSLGCFFTRQTRRNSTATSNQIHRANRRRKAC